MSAAVHTVKVDVVERTASVTVPDNRIVVSHPGPQGPGGSGVTVEDGDARWVNLTGDTMPGALTVEADLRADYVASKYGADVGGHRVTGVADPVDATDAATKGYVDASSRGGGASASWAVWGFGQDVERWRIQQPSTVLDAPDPLVLSNAARASATSVRLEQRGWWAVTLQGSIDGDTTSSAARIDLLDPNGIPLATAVADAFGAFHVSVVLVLEPGAYRVQATHFGPDGQVWVAGQLECVLLKADAPVVPVFPWQEGRP